MCEPRSRCHGQRLPGQQFVEHPCRDCRKRAVGDIGKKARRKESESSFERERVAKDRRDHPEHDEIYPADAGDEYCANESHEHGGTTHRNKRRSKGRRGPSDRLRLLSVTSRS